MCLLREIILIFNFELYFLILKTDQNKAKVYQVIASETSLMGAVGSLRGRRVSGGSFGDGGCCVGDGGGGGAGGGVGRGCGGGGGSGSVGIGDCGNDCCGGDGCGGDAWWW